MAGFHAASDYLKSSFFILLVGGLLLVLSYGFPYWTTSDDGNAGLWKGCNQGRCYDRWNQWNEPWIRACQGFMTMCLFTWSASLFCVVAYIWSRKFDEDRRMIFLGVISAGLTTFCSLIAVLTWSACQHLGNGEILNWAYALCWGNIICSGFATAFLLIELRTPVEYNYY